MNAKDNIRKLRQALSILHGVETEPEGIEECKTLQAAKEQIAATIALIIVNEEKHQT